MNGDARTPKPNILLIMMDQLRWDALGCTGDWVKTPHIDSLAAEGMLFTRCYTTSPVCVPARVSLATGLYPHNTGVWDNRDFTLSPEAPTWMQALRDAGYRTSLFGKTHLHPHRGDLREREHLLHAYGLDDVDEIGGPKASQRVLSHMTERWRALGLWEAYREDYRERFAVKPHMARPSPLPLEEYADVYVGRRAKEYLQAYDREQPWFCWVSFGGPHDPWDTPEPYASLYDPEAMPPPVEWADGQAADRPRGLLDERKRIPFEPGDVARMRASYAGNVTLIDDQVGEILDVVRARGEWDRTVVAVVSDHGEFNGDYGWIHKQSLLDAAARVPLILRLPPEMRAADAHPRAAGDPPGARVGVRAEPVEWIDLGPTLVEIAGGALTHLQYGRSLLSDPPRAEALSEYAGEIMLCDGRWKVVVNRGGRPYLCFDLKNDPRETRNLAGTPEVREVEERLRLTLLERLVSSLEHVPVEGAAPSGETLGRRS